MSGLRTAQRPLRVEHGRLILGAERRLDNPQRPLGRRASTPAVGHFQTVAAAA
jgi:hypothetical protein